MKRCLITGGGGAIGIHIVAHILTNTDWEVVILDSFRHKGYRDRIKEIVKGKPDWSSRIKEIQHDLVCPISPELKKEIGDVNYILHLAAMSDVQFSVDNPVYIIHNNITSTLIMLEYAKHTPHEVFMYFSTDEVLGPVKKGEAHDEWEPHRPSNAYSASKAASEDICYPYWRKGEIKLVITRTMNNFSEMQSPSKFPAMIQKRLENNEKIIIHGNEKEIGTRYYIHSRNVADAVLFILNNLPPYLHKMGELDDPDLYHIVGEVCLSNLELAGIIGKLMGKDEINYELVDFHKDNPAHDIHYGLKDNKLGKAGWKQPLTFEESMKKTIEWQKENKEWIEG